MVRAETSEKQRENEGRGGTYLGRVRKRGKTDGEATHTLGDAENTGKRRERRHIPWEDEKTKGEAAHTLGHAENRGKRRESRHIPWESPN